MRELTSEIDSVSPTSPFRIRTKADAQQELFLKKKKKKTLEKYLNDLVKEQMKQD